MNTGIAGAGVFKRWTRVACTEPGTQRGVDTQADVSSDARREGHAPTRGRGLQTPNHPIHTKHTDAPGEDAVDVGLELVQGAEDAHDAHAGVVLVAVDLLQLVALVRHAGYALHAARGPAQRQARVRQMLFFWR